VGSLASKEIKNWVGILLNDDISMLKKCAWKTSQLVQKKNSMRKLELKKTVNQ
jgi:hypothetical protein